MWVTTANDVKIYNLSSGKTLPEWLDARSSKKKKKSQDKDDLNIRLLQDFEMPVVSDKVKISRDGRYVAAIGTYKPRVKVFEMEQLGLKFERGFDSEAVAFELLEEDYSKMVFLQCDRYVEIHSQSGRYYRLRIPRFGRDLGYHPNHCDMYFVGDSSDIYRLNLEQGRFLSPYTTDSAGSNVCAINPEHRLLTVGTTDGTVEAWDPRSRQRVGKLDCVQFVEDAEEVPQVTALTFRDALNLGVGVSTGQVMLFDLRASKPYQVKDHMYGTKIKKIAFHNTFDHVVSLDAKVVKIWERNTGKPYTAIESEFELNDLAVYPDSGLIFMANEQPRMQVHFIPTLGPAPRWCSFLDNITEELEDSGISEVYDDYKFVTQEQLTDFGLDHLIGTPLLRAYMHGFFMDVRLFRKAQSLMPSHKTGNMIKDKVQKKLAEGVQKRVNLISNLPSVNKDLFLKLKDREEKKKADGSILTDDRFKNLFDDDRFAIDTNEEAYKLLNPVLSKLDKDKAKEIEKRINAEASNDLSNDESQSENDIFSDDDSDNGAEETSSDDDQELSKQIKQSYKEVQRAKKRESRFEMMEAKDVKKKSNKSLESMLEKEEHSRVQSRPDGHQMTFYAKKSKKQKEAEFHAKKHRAERQAVRRSISSLKNRNKKHT